jgi:RNA polymerase sigma factor
VSVSFLPGPRLGAADVRRAQADPAERERLIERFTPFILRVTTRAVGRYVRLGQDDEVSVALIAFNEAIDRFDAGRGGNFLALAETVIRRRLVDHYRRERQHQEIPLSAFAGDDAEREVPFPGEEQAAMATHRADVVAAERREEIERFRQELSQVGIDFRQLLRHAPRHRDARAAALVVARLIATTPEHARFLRERGTLPLGRIDAEVELSRKTLERHRRYIVAVALAMLGDYPYLQTYLRSGGEA